MQAWFACIVGFSRPTLRKWWKRYLTDGINGLASKSRRPKTSPLAKLGASEEELILSLRTKRNLGARLKTGLNLKLNKRFN